MSAPASQESEDEMEDCPICVEPFDESDRLFYPCQCNYRVCMFCVRRLMTEFDGRCPGCRSVYNEANFRIREEDPEEVERRKQKDKLKRQQQGKSGNNYAFNAQAANSTMGTLPNQTNKNSRVGNALTGPAAKKPGQIVNLSPLGGPQGGNQNVPQGGANNDPNELTLAQQRNSLANVRVVQKHVVFVLGLPLSLAKEEILRRPEHFGQYGPIVKIVVGHPASAPGRTASASAHITYKKPEDAQDAIRGVDGRVIDGHQIRASFGTTRYCQAFLRGQQCHNPNCLFLHQEVDPSAQTMPNPHTPAAAAAGTAAANVVTMKSNGAIQAREKAGESNSGLIDPFAVENVPEPLNGIDLMQYEKQRGSRPVQLTKSRAPGADRPSPASPSSNQAPSYDCALSLVADLVVGRSLMPEELRKRLSWIAGPRAKSSQFSGLECVLVGQTPLFIAPVAAAEELKDTPEFEQVIQSAMNTTTENVVNGKDMDSGSSSQQTSHQAMNEASKDKKLSRKNKKAAFAAQNRIGGDDA